MNLQFCHIDFNLQRILLLKVVGKKIEYDVRVRMIQSSWDAAAALVTFGDLAEDVMKTLATRIQS